jgi:predicted MPP superfamily phosphohydrolase
VRLVDIADLHVRKKGPRERALPELVRSLRPDLILHTGDFFGLKRGTVRPIVVELLRSWTVPQYACEGNLDGLDAFDRTMSESGVKVLNGDSAIEQVRHSLLCITGFMSGAEESIPRALATLPSDSFNIVLYHHPEGFPKTWNTRADLMLAGHTHGGQIRLPCYGALITLDKYGKRWESGLFQDHGVTLIVSRGIGCEPNVPEMRFLCPPEIIVIDLLGTGPTRLKDEE